MPTSPRQPHASAPTPIHEARDIAESFGSEADRYARARPSYPEELINRIAATSPGPRVLDVGIGTGIAAGQLQRAGCVVLGVDVDERMAERARGAGFAVETSAFEQWDPAGRTFDAVVAAQAWHWVDPVAGAAHAARALRPRGRLAVFWNLFMPAPELAEAFAAVYRRIVPNVGANPWERSGVESYATILERTEGGIRDAAAFAEPERWRVNWERQYTRDEWLDQIPTFGGHSRFPQATLDELIAQMGDAIDAVGGGFTMAYAAIAVTAARR